MFSNSFPCWLKMFAVNTPRYNYIANKPVIVILPNCQVDKQENIRQASSLNHWLVNGSHGDTLHNTIWSFSVTYQGA